MVQIKSDDHGGRVATKNRKAARVRTGAFASQKWEITKAYPKPGIGLIG